MFYEVMWRAWARRHPVPAAVVVAADFRRWIERHGGLFDSKEAGLASNALYRYWSMVGVKDAHQESLIGQAGEIEPVYERYAVTFFVLDGGRLHLPQVAGAGQRRPGARPAPPGRIPAGDR